MKTTERCRRVIILAHFVERVFSLKNNILQVRTLNAGVKKLSWFASNKRDPPRHLLVLFANIMITVWRMWLVEIARKLFGPCRTQEERKILIFLPISLKKLWQCLIFFVHFENYWPGYPDAQITADLLGVCNIDIVRWFLTIMCLMTFYGKLIR